LANERWISIFEGIDVYEHILTLQFDKTYQQQHSLQFLFSNLPPNQYMLKPTRIAIENWETIWSETDIRKNGTNPDQTFMAQLGIPGDFYRGHGVSYAYMIDDWIMTERARELSFKGQRFFDLMRVAKRRGDPSYLADKIAAKFSGSKAEEIRQHLMDEDNWYVPLND